jgi:hypothetical protein
VSVKKESCLFFYIVPGSHRIYRESSTILIARREFVLSCIVILLPIIVIRRRAFRGFFRKGFHVKICVLVFRLIYFSALFCNKWYQSVRLVDYRVASINIRSFAASSSFIKIEATVVIYEIGSGDQHRSRRCPVRRLWRSKLPSPTEAESLFP